MNNGFRPQSDMIIDSKVKEKYLSIWLVTSTPFANDECETLQLVFSFNLTLL